MVAHYLVTGGCGFIGSHLVDALYTQGHRVRIIDDLSTGSLDYKPAAVELIRGDVADPEVVARGMAGVDGCFHLAAVSAVERANSDWLGTHRTNLSGTIAVFAAAQRAKCGQPIPVVFASSAAVYGDNSETPLSEDTATQPASAYGADKLGCELHARVASRLHGIPTCGLRFFNVYGPRQDGNSPYSGVISIFYERLRVGRGITLFGDGNQIRDFVYVEDVVQALLAAMGACSVAGDVVNVCTGSATAIRDLAVVIGCILGISPDISVAPPRRGDIRASLGDPQKAQRLLSFRATTSLREGLIKTVKSPAAMHIPLSTVIC
jgi:UDP-glucose 4-epimerase